MKLSGLQTQKCGDTKKELSYESLEDAQKTLAWQENLECLHLQCFLKTVYLLLQDQLYKLRELFQTLDS